MQILSQGSINKSSFFPDSSSLHIAVIYDMFLSCFTNKTLSVHFHFQLLFWLIFSLFLDASFSKTKKNSFTKKISEVEKALCLSIKPKDESIVFFIPTYKLYWT